jgi:hypothetical protein
VCTNSGKASIVGESPHDAFTDRTFGLQFSRRIHKLVSRRPVDVKEETINHGHGKSKSEPNHESRRPAAGPGSRPSESRGQDGSPDTASRGTGPAINSDTSDSQEMAMIQPNNENVNPLGLTLIHTPPFPSLDLIFVHGLGGTS